MYYSYYRSFLADALLSLGRVEHGLELVNDAIDNAEISGDNYYLPEFLRLKGEALRASGRHAESARCFRQAWDHCQGRNQRMLALRAAEGLALLEEGSDLETSGGVELIQKTMDSVTEGFDLDPVRRIRRLVKS